MRAIARWLADRGVHPNVISAASVVFSALAAVGVLAAANTEGAARLVGFLAAGLCIQTRLFSNLLDGLVAVEGGRGTASGEIWNELPDRLSDAITLVAAGYAAQAVGAGAALGWAAALLAVLTAYVRALGSAIGARAQFVGPMAKQRRMDVLTLACLVSIVEPFWGWRGQTLALALVVVILGSALTIVRRTRRIAHELKAR